MRLFRVLFFVLLLAAIGTGAYTCARLHTITTPKVTADMKNPPNAKYIVFLPYKGNEGLIYYSDDVLDTALAVNMNGYYTWDGKKWIKRDNSLLLRRDIYGEIQVRKRAE